LKITPIRTHADYEAALVAAQALIRKSDQASIDRLEVLQALIERWETPRLPSTVTTPADAIRFRMEQSNLRPRDLAPYLGSKSRVSEILSGKRQLTVDQIRALHQHLGVPVASLIGPIRHEAPQQRSVASRAAVERLRDMGFIKPKETWGGFMARAARVSPAVAMLRKTRTDRTNAKTDFGALEGWCAAVLLEAEKAKLPRKRPPFPTADDARRLATLSVRDDWSRQLHSELAQLGVVLVILEHLPGTFLDGAAMCRNDGAPVIALTLRHDRLDNFWFTLMHEFAHVCCHLSPTTSVILDDLEVSSSDGIEAEADAFARSALIPDDLWSRKAAAEMTSEDILVLAEEAGVHPAVVAGRWRWEHGDYRKFSRMLGRGEVRASLLG
jgi:HTH-type transcriptional regulator/antitoxin HigA